MAALGLSKIPSSKAEWKEAIEQYGLQDRILGELCLEGRFSASRVPKEAFLTVRCIWPQIIDFQSAAAAIAELEDDFFDENHVYDASTLIGKNRLGLDKLKTLYHILCSPKSPRKRTPPKFSGTLADKLGPFSVLINLYNQLLDKSIQAPAEEPRLTGAPRKVGFYDATQLSTREESPSPAPQGFSSDEFDTEDIEMLDVARSPSLHSSPPAPPTALPAPEPEEGDPPRRTPTETLVADFLVTLLGGLASLVQDLGPRPLCIANSFETTYTFGPIRNTPQSQGEVQFRARIDGSIPFSLSLTGAPREAAIFEVKRAVRKGGRSAIPVLAQQSMEHAAYIWKRHQSDPTWRNKAKTYHTFMVAQDHLHFHISIGTYDNTYLEYIFGPGTEKVVPTRDDSSFLEIQEYGPFAVTVEEEFEKFLLIMLCFLIWQFDRTGAEATLKDALN